MMRLRPGLRHGPGLFGVTCVSRMLVRLQRLALVLMLLLVSMAMLLLLLLLLLLRRRVPILVRIQLRRMRRLLLLVVGVRWVCQRRRPPDARIGAVGVRRHGHLQMLQLRHLRSRCAWLADPRRHQQQQDKGHRKSGR